MAGIWADSRACGFTMACEPLTCSLLRTLAAAKPLARFLGLGSGSELSTAWLLDGMDAASSLITVNNGRGPAGHAGKVADLVATLEQREDFRLTQLSWASGVILATRR